MSNRGVLFVDPNTLEVYYLWTPTRWKRTIRGPQHAGDELFVDPNTLEVYYSWTPTRERCTICGPQHTGGVLFVDPNTLEVYYSWTPTRWRYNIDLKNDKNIHRLIKVATGEIYSHCVQGSILEGGLQYK